MDRVLVWECVDRPGTSGMMPADKRTRCSAHVARSLLGSALAARTTFAWTTLATRRRGRPARAWFLETKAMHAPRAVQDRGKWRRWRLHPPVVPLTPQLAKQPGQRQLYLAGLKSAPHGGLKSVLHLGRAR
jgi:hypothetical protein